MRKGMKTFTCVLAAAVSMNSSMAVFAEDTNSSGKEEVIYIMSDANGAVENIYGVNIFSSGDVTDYGNYSDVKLLNTNDKVTLDGDKLTFSSDASKVYCQATLKDAQNPWNISIKYFLDGKEMSPEDVAGKSGKLEIKFHVTQNPMAVKSFYKNYALQASFTLDTDKCSDITADKATIANVGSKKQLNYTILPGEGIDTSITANVKDFEMDEVAINGVKLSIDVNFDTSEITDQADQLTNGVKKINKGATSVKNGSGDLKDGSGKLKDGAKRLDSGAKSLNSGIKDLETGVKKLQTGLDAINAQSNSLTDGSAKVKNALAQIQQSLSNVSTDTSQLKELTQASGKIKKGISDLKAGTDELQKNVGYTQYKTLLNQKGLNIDDLKANNTKAISTLQEQIKKLNDQASLMELMPQYQAQAKTIREQTKSLGDVVKLLTGNNAAIGGTEVYLNSLSDAVGKLAKGVNSLNKQYDKFDKAIGTLADSLSSMIVNLTKLTNAIHTLNSQYAKLDDGIGKYTSGVGQVHEGYNSLIQGVEKLASGSKSMLKGSNTLSSGASDLYDGVSKLCDGAGKLSNGTGKLQSKTDGIGQEIEDKIDEVVKPLKGDETETVSFTSQKNTNVKSVQFVIKTKKIEKKEEVKVEEDDNQKSGFWQKLVHLFKK